jgi:hypothetical protein
MESMVDIHQQKDFPVFKREHTTSDVDSGTEEIEQQLEYVAITESFDKADQSSIQSFSPTLDEGFSECYREEEAQNQMANEESKLPLIEDDRKLHNTLSFFCLVIMTQRIRNVAIPLTVLFFSF